MTSPLSMQLHNPESDLRIYSNRGCCRVTRMLLEQRLAQVHVVQAQKTMHALGSVLASLRLALGS